ncbi:hypothetical protein LVB87_11170 [Lysobacter sp. KIS68-7]|uniref:hypothetical protein n=1 Tax=Lysobacter sp. KIS68-7 TaxID=2904252 RepID=UPI001E54322E|nr:hypothetical protein [Lysobacter sp. KIS68-7]UHQ18745.1 hypothetical protein LVB87_11170 [Lysobacter sp. KIS68-7]
MRKFSVSVLAAATVVALGAAHAQVRVEAPPSDIRGRAPIVTIDNVVNESVPGQEPAVGHTLKASASVVDPDDDTITGTTYHWKRGDTEVGTGQEYTTTPADAGQTLTLQVDATTDAAITDPAIGSATQDVAVAANTAPTAAPTITGTVTLEEQLTGVPNITDADNDTIGGSTYQWYRADNAAGTANRIAIAGATNLTYTITAEDSDKYLVFEVVPRTSTGTPNAGVATSAVTLTAVTMTAPTAAPEITGTLKTHQLLTGHANYHDAENDVPGAHQYKWYTATDAEGTDRTPIPGATSDTFTLTGEEQGKYLVFEVTPVSTKAPTTGVPKRAVTALVPGTEPRITSLDFVGTFAVGQELVGTYDYRDAEDDAEDTDATIMEWLVGDPDTGELRVVPGATRKFTIRPEDAGVKRFIIFRVLSVRSLTGSPREGNSGAINYNGVVTGPDMPFGSAPSISGTPDQGLTLTANFTYQNQGASNPGPGTHAYQWYVSSNESGSPRGAIVGATGQTYTLKPSDQGRYFVVDIKPKSNLGGIGPIVTGKTTVESPYRVSTGWTVRSSETIDIPLAISGRSGNAPSNLRVGASRGTQGVNDQPISVELIGPNGASLGSRSLNVGGDTETWDVNASSQTKNGTWNLRVTAPDFGNPSLSTDITQFTLQFDHTP